MSISAIGFGCQPIKEGFSSVTKTVKKVTPRPELRKTFDRFNGLPKNEWDKNIGAPAQFVQDFLRSQRCR